MADITIEQLQDVLGRPVIDLGNKLEAQQKTQAATLAKVLKDIIGEDRNNISQYENIISQKFGEVIAYLKEFTKNVVSSNQSTPAIEQPETEKKQVTDDKSSAFGGVKSVTLSTAVNASTKAIPVRVIEALNLKKIKEIDTRHKSEVNIDIPPETRVWLENLLFDNFKDFTDELFERKGGLHDLYNAVYGIDKLLESKKFGNDKKDDESWLSKLLKGLGLAELLAGLGAAAAALAGVAAFLGGMKAVGGFGKGRLGKALSEKAKPTVEEEINENKKPKTETEEAYRKTKDKIEQKELEFDEKNEQVNEQLEKLNEDLVAKRQEVAKAEQAKIDASDNNYKADQARQAALAEAEEKSIKAKETQAEVDIQAAEDAKTTAEDATAKATEANVRYQELSTKYNDLYQERFDIESKIKTLEADQLKAIDEHNTEIKNIKEGKPTEPLGSKTKAALPEEAATAADIGKSAEAAAGAAENAAKAAEAVAKISKVAKVGGAVAVVAGAGYEAYEGSKEFKQIEADLKEKKITEDEARKRKEDVVGGRTGKFAASTGGALAGGVAAGEVGAALGLLTGPAAVVVSPLLALGFGIAGSIAGEKAVKAFKLDEMAGKVGKKVSEGIGEMVNKSKEATKDSDPANLGYMGNTVKSEKDFQPSSTDNKTPDSTSPSTIQSDTTKQPGPVAPIAQAAPIVPTEPPDQYKQIFTNPPVDTTTADGLSDMSDSLDEHSKLLKGLIEYQKQTATNTKDLIQAFLKSQNNNSNVNVNNFSNSTNIVSNPVTSSLFRQAVLQR